MLGISLKLTPRSLGSEILKIRKNTGFINLDARVNLAIETAKDRNRLADWNRRRVARFSSTVKIEKWTFSAHIDFLGVDFQ
jgi:hypothetical protein